MGNHRRGEVSAHILKGEVKVAMGSWRRRLGGGQGGWRRPGAELGIDTATAWCWTAGRPALASIKQVAP